MKLRTIFISLAPWLMMSCSQTEFKSETCLVDDASAFQNRILSPEQASEIATKFMLSLTEDQNSTRGDESLGTPIVELLDLSGMTRSESVDTVFYVVSFEKGGYTLVAADPDLDNNIYVFSETGEFDMTNNKVFEVYLDNAMATMSEAPRRTDSASQESMTRAITPPNPDAPIYEETEINGVLCRASYKTNHTQKKPLLKTLWHQEYPYNIYCPMQNGENTLVGCVAIAMGQICAYHRLPESLDGNNLEWDWMLAFDRHDSVYTFGLHEVADFIHKIGIKVNMAYGLESSGASDSDAINGFKKLGYTSVKKYNFSTEKCVNSLKLNEPVMMFGRNSKGEGHAWVTDGCDKLERWVEYYRVDNGELYASYPGVSYTYLHFNAGWHGTKANTYYLCSGKGKSENNTYQDFSVFDFNKGNLIITDIRH